MKAASGVDELPQLHFNEAYHGDYDQLQELEDAGELDVLFKGVTRRVRVAPQSFSAGVGASGNGSDQSSKTSKRQTAVEIEQFQKNLKKTEDELNTMLDHYEATTGFLQKAEEDLGILSTEEVKDAGQVRRWAGRVFYCCMLVYTRFYLLL